MLRKVTGLVQRSGRSNVLAWALVYELEESFRASEVCNLRSREAAEDAQDLHVLPPLEHAGRDEQAKQGITVLARELFRSDGERADPGGVGEHRQETKIMLSTVVRGEVPPDHCLNLSNLRSLDRRRIVRATFADAVRWRRAFRAQPYAVSKHVCCMRAGHFTLFLQGV